MKAAEIDIGKSAVCQAILDDLPDWFGIASAKNAYVAASADLPMFVCHEGREPIGFLSIKHQTDHAAELFVMGVKPRFHRRGIGRALVEVALHRAAADGLRFLTVKTLASTSPDPHYAATRCFYEAAGFVPLEVFPTLWTSRNPCLLMIRAV